MTTPFRVTRLADHQNPFRIRRATSLIGAVGDKDFATVQP